jgi:hypothetical protein
MSATYETNPYNVPGSAPVPPAGRAKSSMHRVGRAVGSIAMTVVGIVIGYTVMGALLHHGTNTARPTSPTSWTTVALDNAATVAMPPGATHSAQETVIGTGNVTVDMWIAHSGGYDYAVGRSPLPQLSDSTRGPLLRSSALGAFTAAHIDTPVLTDTTVDGFTAVQGVGQIDGHTMEGAFVYAHGALYELIVGGPHANLLDLKALTNSFSTR